MSKKLQPVRGTHDHLKDSMHRYNYIVSLAEKICVRYGFEAMSTPIFEFSEIFQKTLGDTSDIVTKEMYTFTDKGNESITLRPEGTAGIIRAIISNGLTHQMPFKAFYNGPMFRYERPQKGRLRQFHQIGVELVGSKEELADIEVITCAKRLLTELKIDDEITLNINSLGSTEDRKKYIKDLISYLKVYKNKLSSDSLKRFDKNPLRILDSKNEEDIQLLVNAPIITDYLNNESKNNFNNILNILKSLNIPYIENPKLVRGLDYYNNTTFEFVSNNLGSQGAIIAGGRYDGLMKQMGGPDLPGIGWAAGIERINILFNLKNIVPNNISIIPLGDDSLKYCIQISEELRKEKIIVNMAFSGNIKKRLQNANKASSNYALIIGDNELKNNIAIIKDLKKNDQKNIKLDQVINYIKKISK